MDVLQAKSTETYLGCKWLYHNICIDKVMDGISQRLDTVLKKYALFCQ